MKNMRRIIALLLTIVMVVTCSACATAGKWIAKAEDGTEIPVGVWIWLLYNDYYEAYTMASDSSVSPLNQTIEEKKGETWIVDTAKSDLESMLTVKKLANELGLKLDAAKLKEVTASVNSVWETSSESYEVFGISKASLQAYYEFTELSTLVFNYYYGIGGKKGNTKESLIKYVEESCKNVQYVAVAITEDSDSKELTEAFNEMAEKYRQGTSVDDIVKEYNEKNEVDVKANSSTFASVELTSSSSDLEKAMQNTKAGEATVVKSNDVMYVLFGRDIKDVSKDYVEESSDEILQRLHEEEYMELLEDEAEKVTYELNNKAYKKYSPKWLEKVAG